MRCSTARACSSATTASPAPRAPIDIFKLLASPNAQFKEIIRPVPQVSATLQLSPTLSLGGYAQFRGEEDRLAPSGSFFSTANVPWGSAQPEFINVQGVGSFVRAPGGDRHARDSGQFGMQLKWRLDDTDLGFYEFALTYTHFIGAAVPFVDLPPLTRGGSAIYPKGKPLADRDNLAFTMRRTF